MLSEAELISRYFKLPSLERTQTSKTNVDIALGIGDDCAILQIPNDMQLVCSMDVLIAGRHFFEDSPADLCAWRALAVNLSDLAAMGATPHSFTLGLTLPAVSEEWLSAFSKGLQEAVEYYECPLVGGNLARGPLQIAIQVNGLVPAGKALLRSKAQPGDYVYVSGEPGLAALALQQYKAGHEPSLRCQRAYYKPEARLTLGAFLLQSGLVSSAIDISDGLLLDLQRLAQASSVQIEIDIVKLPLSREFESKLSVSQARTLVLTGGDDYELLFTSKEILDDDEKKKAETFKIEGTPVYCIGRCLPLELKNSSQLKHNQRKVLMPNIQLINAELLPPNIQNGIHFGFEHFQSQD